MESSAKKGEQLHNTRMLYADWRISAATHSMIYHCKDGIAWFDTKGRIFHHNPQFMQMFGQNRTTLRRRNLAEIPVLYDALQKDFNDVFSGEYFTQEIEIPVGKTTYYFAVELGPLWANRKIFGGYLRLRDITEIRHQEELLRERELLLRQLVTKAGLGIVIIGQDHRVIEANERFAEMLGYTHEEVLNLYTWDWEVITSEEEVRKQFSDLSRVDTIFETKHRRKDGTIFDVEVSAKGTSFKGKNEKYNAVICICRDISKRKAYESEIKYLSFHDELTGLYNRRFLEVEMKRLDVERNLPLSMIVGDVNGLKLINDAFGHFKGDELIKATADALKKACRADDLIARWGGDEFVIILPQTDLATAKEIIERIKRHVDEIDLGLIKLSISLGAATKEKMSENIHEILADAETNMYRRKLQESQNVIRQAIALIHDTFLEKNPEAAQHAKTVGKLCQKIALAMGFSETTANEMEALGLLHDIGKINVPLAILKKPGVLTETEWSEVSRHAEIGYRILSAANETADLARYVLYHHERFDGYGYPAGKKGAEIPLQSRILAVADAYDAMTNDRPYRKALTRLEAAGELKKHAETQFDPKVVSVFVEKVLPTLN